MRIGAILGIHVQSDGFEQSVRFITTDDARREDPPRVPMVGAHTGCMFGRSPGASARALDAELKDLEAARRQQSQMTLTVTRRVSEGGVLRFRRVIV